MLRLLLLAGSGEAREIAQGLAQEPGLIAKASLAGATRVPRTLALPTRMGGFGGDEGFRTYLLRNAIDAVLDATHPFAHRVSARSARICAEEGVSYAQVLRPEWVPGPGDDWRFIDHGSEAAGFVEPGSTVFLGTGVQGLDAFGNLQSCKVICRRIDPPMGPFPFPGGEFLVGRPPFSVADEISLFSQLDVDWLVVKNSGGTASRTKLDAARQLGIRVALIRRPKQPDATRLETVEEAIEWVRNLA